MQITKTHHESGTGIYANSLPVKTKDEWRVAKEVAQEMIEWLNKENGTFKGEHSRAFAMAHCQVVDHDHPIKLFVVDSQLVLPEKLEKDSKQTIENSFFEAQAIFNAEILETPEKITRRVPKRNISTAKDGKVEVSVSMEEKEISNRITVPEGCMSFDHRTAKNTERFYRVKVRYQYIGKGLLGGEKVKTFEGWVTSLKAHIIQHEVDHFNTKNIYF